ncbi:hypothetical protein Q7P37_007547 [Cladosporium fusiforme]
MVYGLVRLHSPFKPSNKKTRHRFNVHPQPITLSDSRTHPPDDWLSWYSIEPSSFINIYCLKTCLLPVAGVVSEVECRAKPSQAKQTLLDSLLPPLARSCQHSPHARPLLTSTYDIPSFYHIRIAYSFLSTIPQHSTSLRALTLLASTTHDISHGAQPEAATAAAIWVIRNRILASHQKHHLGIQNNGAANRRVKVSGADTRDPTTCAKAAAPAHVGARQDDLSHVSRSFTTSTVANRHPHTTGDSANNPILISGDSEDAATSRAVKPSKSSTAPVKRGWATRPDIFGRKLVHFEVGIQHLKEMAAWVEAEVCAFETDQCKYDHYQDPDDAEDEALESGCGMCPFGTYCDLRAERKLTRKVYAALIGNQLKETAPLIMTSKEYAMWNKWQNLWDDLLSWKGHFYSFEESPSLTLGAKIEILRLMTAWLEEKMSPREIVQYGTVGFVDGGS